jgi:hypothetical protein
MSGHCSMLCCRSGGLYRAPVASSRAESSCNTPKVFVLPRPAFPVRFHRGASARQWSLVDPCGCAPDGRHSRAHDTQVKKPERIIRRCWPHRGRRCQVIVGAMPGDANRGTAKSVGGGIRPMVVTGVNNVSGYQRQEAGHAHADVLANSWKLRFSHVLTLVPLKDEPNPRRIA